MENCLLFFFFFFLFQCIQESHRGCHTPRLFDWFIWVFESMWAGTKHILKCERQKVAASVAMLNLTMYDWDIAVESRSGLRSFIVKDYIDCDIWEKSLNATIPPP